MRYLSFSLLFAFVLTSLFSCTDTKENKDTDEKVALMAANWSDTTALAKAIDVFYKDSVLRKGDIALPVRDGFIQSKIPYHYLMLHKIYRPQFKLASPTIGSMPVLMLSDSDSAIVDFQITWQQINPTDSLGQFVVTDNFLQSFKNQPRYEWIQEDNKYWIRKNVERDINTTEKSQNRFIDMELKDFQKQKAK